MKMFGTKIVIGFVGLTACLASAWAAKQNTVYDPSHDPDQAMIAPQTPRDVKSHFDSKGNDCGAELDVTDAYITHFRTKKSKRARAAVFFVTVKNQAHAKNIYVTPTNQGPLHTKSLAQPFKGAYDSAITSYIHTDTNASGLDTFTVLDDRVRKLKTFVFDLSVVVNGQTVTCSDVKITRK